MDKLLKLLQQENGTEWNSKGVDFYLKMDITWEVPLLFPATIPPFLGWNRKANRQIMDELRWFYFYKITNKNNVCKFKSLTDNFIEMKN